jgi:hypothetical protein
MKYLTADTEGTTLYLDLKEGYAYDIDAVTTRVEVTMPELTSLSLSSSAYARLDGFQTSKPLELEFTGSTYLNGTRTADELSLQINGSGLVELSGSSRDLRLDVCGSGLVELSDLVAYRSEIDLACSDTTIVQVSERLAVDTAQNAQLHYVGIPGQRVINVHQSASIPPYKE